MSVIAMIRKGKSVGSTKTESVNSIMRDICALNAWLKNSSELKGEISKQFASRLVDNLFAKEEARKQKLQAKTALFESLPELGKLSFDSILGEHKEISVKLMSNRDGIKYPAYLRHGFCVSSVGGFVKYLATQQGVSKIVKSWEIKK